jgi:predicted dehydrogenase
VTAASSQPPVGIGILATGTIASAFVADLAHVPDATAVAVGSRRQESADAFARRHGIASAHGSYEQLLDDDAVELVYVATPHALHEQNVLDCLDAGKAVLCEKPLGVNAAEAERMVAAARARGLFFAEAMWMRCNPTLRRMVDGVRAGWIGDVRTVSADLSFVGSHDPASRLHDPKLGASALLDVGIYPLTFAAWLLGSPPTEIVGAAAIDERGVDDSASLTLTYAAGQVASLTCSQVSWGDCRASVAGTEGRLEVAPRMNVPPSVTRYGPDWPAPVIETVAEPLLGSGLAHEAIEAARCLRAGETESPLLPLDDSLAVAQLLDQARAACGVRLPADTP